jgi:hypothetical protein
LLDCPVKPGNDTLWVTGLKKSHGLPVATPSCTPIA